MCAFPRFNELDKRTFFEIQKDVGVKNNCGQGVYRRGSCKIPRDAIVRQYFRFLPKKRVLEDKWFIAL